MVAASWATMHHKEASPTAQKIRVLGIDIAKLVFHVVGMDDTGHVVLRSGIDSWTCMRYHHVWDYRGAANGGSRHGSDPHHRCGFAAAAWGLLAGRSGQAFLVEYSFDTVGVYPRNCACGVGDCEEIGSATQVM